jgi:hypothetical protein
VCVCVCVCVCLSACDLDRRLRPEFGCCATTQKYLSIKSACIFQDLVVDESQSMEILKRLNRIVLILKVSGIS